MPPGLRDEARFARLIARLIDRARKHIGEGYDKQLLTRGAQKQLRESQLQRAHARYG